MKLCNTPWSDSIRATSMLTQNEVAQLVGCTPTCLSLLQEWCGFPEPRTVNRFETRHGRVHKTPYWRAGDIIVWAKGTDEELTNELKKEIGGRRRVKWRSDLRRLVSMRKSAGG